MKKSLLIVMAIVTLRCGVVVAPIPPDVNFSEKPKQHSLPTSVIDISVPIQFKSKEITDLLPKVFTNSNFPHANPLPNGENLTYKIILEKPAITFSGEQAYFTCELFASKLEIHRKIKVDFPLMSSGNMSIALPDFSFEQHMKATNYRIGLGITTKLCPEEDFTLRLEETKITDFKKIYGSINIATNTNNSRTSTGDLDAALPIDVESAIRSYVGRTIENIVREFISNLSFKEQIEAAWCILMRPLPLENSIAKLTLCLNPSSMKVNKLKADTGIIRLSARAECKPTFLSPCLLSDTLRPLPIDEMAHPENSLYTVIDLSIGFKDISDQLNRILASKITFFRNLKSYLVIDQVSVSASRHDEVSFHVSTRGKIAGVRVRRCDLYLLATPSIDPITQELRFTNWKYSKETYNAFEQEIVEVALDNLELITLLNSKAHIKLSKEFDRAKNKVQAILDQDYDRLNVSGSIHSIENIRVAVHVENLKVSILTSGVMTVDFALP